MLRVRQHPLASRAEIPDCVNAPAVVMRRAVLRDRHQTDAHRITVARGRHGFFDFVRDQANAVREGHAGATIIRLTVSAGRPVSEARTDPFNPRICTLTDLGHRATQHSVPVIELTPNRRLANFVETNQTTPVFAVVTLLQPGSLLRANGWM